MNSSRAARAAAVVALPAVLTAVALLTPRPPGVLGAPPAVVGATESHIPAEMAVGHSYVQALGSVGDGLSEVGIYATPGGKGEPAPLQAELLSEGGAVRHAAGAYVPGSDTVRFAFAPLVDSSRRALSLRLTLAATTPALAFTLYYVERAPAGAPHLLQDGADTGGSLPMRLRYGSAAPAAGQLVAISDRASQYHPGLLKTPVPLVAAALAMVTATALLLVVSGALPVPD